MICPDTVSCYCPLDPCVTASAEYTSTLTGEIEVRQGATPLTLRPLTADEEDRVIMRAMRYPELPADTDPGYWHALWLAECLTACAIGSPSSSALPHHWRVWIGSHVLRLTREVAPYLPTP